MDVMPWQGVVLVGIPEVFLIILLGFTLIGVRPNLRRLGMVAALGATIMYFIRALPLPFGIHLLFNLATMILLARIVMGYKWKILLPGVLLGFAIFTGIIDALYVPVLIRYVPMEQILSKPWLRVAVSLPEQAIMLAVILLCRKYGIKVVNMSSDSREVM